MSRADKHEGLLGLPNQDPKLKDLVADHVVQPFSALRVKNKVTYVHPEVTSGLENFTLGAPTDLACQIALGPSKQHPDRIVYARTYHYRSAIISARAHIVIDGQEYNYLDAKGTGMLAGKERKITDPDEKKYVDYIVATTNLPSTSLPEKTWGLATQGWVDIDNSMSGRLEYLGIRTVPIVAIANIEEVMDSSGNKISIAEAKSKGYLAHSTEPVIIYRAWITPFRLIEASYTPEMIEKDKVIHTKKDIETKRVIVRTAIQDIQNDTSIPLEVRKSFSDISQYLRWLASTIGSNLGKMHKHGITHGFLAGLHNITLDGRFIDLDDMVENSSPRRIEEEQKSLFDPKWGGTTFQAF